jgi:hypothetical protein
MFLLQESTPRYSTRQAIGCLEIGLQSFSLVPEPASWALLALGAGALFWKCRGRFKKE